MRKLVTLLFTLLLILACSEEELYTDNPFDVETEEDALLRVLDSSSIEGLQQNIFSLKCANPTCHDGSFEPDFRTTESTYNSLVFHQVTKNTPDEDFEHRVVPGQPDSSWLYYRLGADSILGRMPLYADPLSKREKELIQNWILRGAPNSKGEIPQVPNLSPVIYGYNVHDSAGTRIDQNRDDGWASHMILPKNEDIRWTFYIEDDRTPGPQLKVHRLEFSLDHENWQVIHSLNFVRLWDVVFIQNMNTQELPSDTLVYFRYYVEDADGGLSIRPNANSPGWLVDHYTLVIE